MTDRQNLLKKRGIFSDLLKRIVTCPADTAADRVFWGMVRMAHVIEFEVCGLHYILTWSDDVRLPGLQFRIRDEAFLGAVATFSAWSSGDLFSKIENHIEIALPNELRNALSIKFDALDDPAISFRGMAAALGKAPLAQNPQGWGKIAVGMR